MNPIQKKRWWVNRKVARTLADQLRWFEEAMELLAKDDPERALRVAAGVQAILSNAFDPADPMAQPHAVTNYVMNELLAAAEAA